MGKGSSPPKPAKPAKGNAAKKGWPHSTLVRGVVTRDQLLTNEQIKEVLAEITSAKDHG